MRLLFILLFPCYVTSIADDCSLVIESPINGGVYSISEANLLYAKVDVKVGIGPITTAIRSNPDDFEICLIWDYYERDVKSPDWCRGLVAGENLPNFRSFVPVHKAGLHHFLVFLRTNKDFLNPHPLVINEVSFILTHSNNDVDETSTEKQHQNQAMTHNCRAAICVSGQWRTFADLEIRRLFRDNLLGGLSGSAYGGGPTCHLDVFFFAKPTDEVTDRNYFFGRTSAAPTSAASIRQVIWDEFPELLSRYGENHMFVNESEKEPLRVIITSSDHQYPIQTTEGSTETETSSISGEEQSSKEELTWMNDHLSVAWPALSSVAESYHMALAYEEHYGFKYDWVIRTRFDLSYFMPLPPLVPLSTPSIYDVNAVMLPYTSLPISDVFAVCPGRLAHTYFEANKQCMNGSLSNLDFQRGAGPTEEFLLRHLLAHETSLRLVDFPLSIVRPHPDSRCQGLPVLGLACMTLLGLPQFGSPFVDSAQCSAASSLAMASRCDRVLGDQGRSPQLRAIVGVNGSGGSGSGVLENVMRQFLNVTFKQQMKLHMENPSDIAEEGGDLPLMHTITMSAHLSILKENAAAGISVPRSVELRFFQHVHETNLAREALSCLFLDYFFHLGSPLEVIRQTLVLDEISIEYSKCFASDGGLAVSRHIERWTAAAWRNIEELRIT